MQERVATMRSVRFLTFVLSALLPLPLLAAGSGQQTTTGTSQTGTSTITVIVPAVIGVDVESDIFFDFSNAGGRTFNQSYTAGTAASTAACGDNQWPLAAFCTGSARYDPSVNVTGGAP